MSGQQQEAQGTPLLRNRYRLLRIIGRGGTSTVHRARDEALGRDVAVKLFNASATAETDFKRQEDEVNLLATLNHPNCVTILDAAVDRQDPLNPRIFFVMELVEGSDLQSRRAVAPLSSRSIAQIGLDVAEAIEYIHHRGVVHRDMKPGNVLIGDYVNDPTRIRAKLSDFGLASIGASAALQEGEELTATLAYASPEQAAGAAVSRASDIYSFGLVLLYCFTGELAFPGTPDDSAIARLASDPPIPAMVPDDWRELIEAMTDRRVGMRPLASEVVLFLRQAVRREYARHRLIEKLERPEDVTRMDLASLEQLALTVQQEILLRTHPNHSQPIGL